LTFVDPPKVKLSLYATNKDYLLATPQVISSAINAITIAPTVIPITAPRGSSSSDSSISGTTVKVGVITDDVIEIVVGVMEMVGGGVVNNLEGVTIAATIMRKWQT